MQWLAFQEFQHTFIEKFGFFGTCQNLKSRSMSLAKKPGYFWDMLGTAKGETSIPGGGRQAKAIEFVAEARANGIFGLMMRNG